MASPQPPTEPHLSTYLHPGQLFASAERYSVSTILGTCVSVCLWDQVHRVGGMNHFLLPDVVSGAMATPRFGNIACHRLLERVLALGARQRNLVAKIFGGSSPTLDAPSTRDLGARNVEVALRVMAAERIPVVASDVGGAGGRKIVFVIDDGAVWVRSLTGAMSFETR
jgi:chemotaxis protein CheD